MKKTNEVIRVGRTMNKVNRGISVTDVITNSLFKNEIKIGEQITIPNKVYFKSNKKLVNITMQLTYEDMDLARELDYYDKAVHDAICGLWYNGFHEFTTEFVYRMMIGDSGNQGGINVARLRLENSINTLNNIKLSLECKDDDGNSVLSINNNLIPMERCRVIIKNGSELDGWKLLSEPTLYQYAKSINRVECFKLELIKTPLAFTESNVKLVKFLFDRMLLIKSKVRKDGELWKRYKDCNVIRFTKLYEIVNIDDKDHSSKSCIKRNRILEKCDKVFDYWMNEAETLEKWVHIKEGKRNVGYRLKVKLIGFKELYISDWGDGEIEKTYEDVVFRDHNDHKDEWEELQVIYTVIESDEMTDKKDSLCRELYNLRK